MLSPDYYFSTDNSDRTPSFGAGFVPVVPSQLDPRSSTAVALDEPHLNPIFAEQNFRPSFFRGGFQLPARPFSNPYISSSSTKGYSDKSILGSGDFSVLSGGTFYQPGDQSRPTSHDYYGSGSSFYDSADSSRPFALPLESSHSSGDPFASFKDFADITAGIDSDFSHLVAVYAQRSNSTEPETKHEPKNIFEQLEMIDEEKRNEKEAIDNTKSATTTLKLKPINLTKLSKFKSKLRSTKLAKAAKTKQVQKKLSAAMPLDYYVDPLVAES